MQFQLGRILVSKNGSEISITTSSDFAGKAADSAL